MNIPFQILSIFSEEEEEKKLFLPNNNEISPITAFRQKS